LNKKNRKKGNMALPATQCAVLIREKGVVEVVESAPVPKLRDGYVLVKTVAVALNPTDWKHVDYLPTPGALVGCDYAGTVVEVGKGVTKGFRKGDRIAGFVHGCKWKRIRMCGERLTLEAGIANQSQLEDGAFAEYIVARGDVQMLIPGNISFEEAATLGVGIVTVGQALYQSLGLQLPTEPVKESIPVLVYGGSTATGTLAIQFAKL
jgi:NADPH:quinone reductase-like Zn-dependent oxidoreductase